MWDLHEREVLIQADHYATFVDEGLLVVDRGGLDNVTELNVYHTLCAHRTPLSVLDSHGVAYHLHRISKLRRSLVKVAFHTSQCKPGMVSTVFEYDGDDPGIGGRIAWFTPHRAMVISKRLHDLGFTNVRVNKVSEFGYAMSRVDRA